ncbi:TPA: hypothetical protein I8Y09_004529 [Raoultella ornithinolytica]|nr:hypothetical protein [Raoultella ornithinolytica]
MNNISGKAYIDNGYIRNAYEITVFNNDITERFHEAPITNYRWSKRRGIVLQERSAMGPQKSGAKCVETVMPDKSVRCGIAGITTQRRRSLSDR